MSTQETADQLVKLCKSGKFDEAMESLYGTDIESVEAAPPPSGGDRAMKGIEAVREKGKWWAENHEVHSVEVDGPLVAGKHFCVKFSLDVTFKPAARRMTMVELAVYQVADGKIVREEFFYSMG